MKLKSITVFGFKTFAEQTSLDFENGITAIVGPNGSGKSNLVDAIRWVLGEQSSKSLRSGKTEDVIFAGNEKRKPLGMTEVSLTFDNSDGRLPIEFSEVQFTRRAYRAGDIEYYINRNHVLLRDVLDLLVGTGLGSGSYAIVSQGEIDAVLSSRPSERRVLFEEAAGINRFLARKNEALRRLEQTETNAIRINDLIAELQRRIPELDTQVRRAKRHRRVSTRLRQLEILSYLRASASRRTERERIVAELDRNQNRCELAAAAAATSAAELSATRYRAYQQELTLEEQRGVAAQRRAQVASLEAEYAATLARREALEAQGTKTSVDAARIGSERSAIEETISGLQERVAPLQAQLESARAAQEQAQRRLAQAHLELDTVFTSLREAEAVGAKALAEAAALRVRGDSARAEADRLEDEATNLSAECEQLARSVGTGTDNYAERQRELERLENELLEARGGVEHAEASFAAVSRALGEKEREYRDYCSEVASAQARLHTIEELEASLEGHLPGTRAVMEAFGRGELAGVRGIVSNIIEVDERYARALDVAFGARLSNIVMNTLADARRALDYLTINELGRATFLPLDGLRSRRGNDIGNLGERRGVIGYAHRLITTDPELSGAIAFLVGKVLIVDTLQTGMAVVEETALRDTIVSLSGEQIIAGVALSGGRSKRERSILSRRLQAQALREQLPKMMERLQQLEIAVQLARDRAQETSRERDAAKERANRVEVALAKLRAEMSNVGAAIERSRRELALARERIATLRAKAEEYRCEQRAFEPSPASSQSDERRTRLEAELANLRGRIAQAEDALAATAAHAGNVREELATLSAQHEGARARLALLHADTQRAVDAGGGVRAQLSQLQDEAQHAQSELARSRQRVDAAEARVLEIRAERDRTNAQITELEGQARMAELQEREAAAEGERHRTRLAQIEAELGMLAAGFAQNPATQSECEDVEERYKGEETDAAAELPKLREDLARLSSVNLNAEADRQELWERETFLREQMGDLAKARETLLEVIREIDASTQEQFNITFNAVSAAFTEMFARVFPGGQARMWQTNPDELAETGIEISIQPPGKKMMPLAALSGGERAMTAAALIFALIKVRPSPFYLLDEVDAALDEANVERFSDMIRELAVDAQMLIVTHNKKTMELADRMYGVTMAEPGVSSVVSTELSPERSREPVFA